MALFFLKNFSALQILFLEQSPGHIPHASPSQSSVLPSRQVSKLVPETDGGGFFIGLIFCFFKV